jgi:large subunit ribosomal protein L29
MKLSEMRDKTHEELQKEVLELKSELYRLRFQHATNNLDNPLRLKEVRRNIARAKTIIKELELKNAN